MPLQKLEFRPGLNREGTDYANEGGWYDGDKVRFRSGFPEKIGGWTQVSSSTYIGTARSLVSWVDTDGQSNYLGIGTSIKYYIYKGGAFYDITPFVVTDTLSGPFTATNGSNVLTVTDATYLPNVGDYVVFSGATSLGGNITAAVLNQEYVVTSTTPSTNKYTVAAYSSSVKAGFFAVGTQYVIQYAGTTDFTLYGASSNAVGTLFTATSIGTGSGIAGIAVFANTTDAANHGGTVTASYEYPSGLNNFTFGTGWGAGPWSRGTWNSAYSTGVSEQLRLWSGDNFGSDLVIAPRGGPIFYWQDYYGVSTRAVLLSSLANQNTFTSDNATFTNGVTSISVSATAAAILLPYMYITGTNLPANTQIAGTYSPGSLTVPITTTTTGASSGSYTFSYAGAYVPNSTNQVITSAIQKFVIAFGANSYQAGTPNTSYNPMLVRWSDQLNPYQWVPQVTNQSGEFTLTNGSYIVGARATRQEILVWTDSAIYSMQYLGSPYVWGFNILMDNISVMSPNAMITVNNVTYWMGVDKFYVYSGTVETLPCSIRQYIFDNINTDQAFQVFAGSNEGYNEVWWFYVSDASVNNTVDKYVIYNYVDRVWYYGTMARTAWVDTGTNPYPIAADYNNRILYHESSVDDVSGSTPVPIDAYVQSSDFDIGDGHNFGFVWRILPDVNFNGSTVNNPSVTMTIKPRQNSGTAYGQADNPTVTSNDNFSLSRVYNIQQFTGQVYTRLRGRQLSFRIESTGLGVAWQLGLPRIDIRPDGRR